MMKRAVAPLLLAGAIAACSGSRRTGTEPVANAAAGERGATLTARSIDEVLAAHTNALMALPGVVGTTIGLCDGERCIKVLLADSSAAAKGKVPPWLEGYRVVVEATGTIRPR